MDRHSLLAVSAFVTVIFVSYLSGYTEASAVERETTKYIVSRVLPADPALASSLLTVLLRSSPSSLRTITRLVERQGAAAAHEYDAMDYSSSQGVPGMDYPHSSERSGAGGPEDLDDEEEEEEESAEGERLPEERRVAPKRGGDPGRRVNANVARLWKPMRSSLTNKRSLGRCIHECINSNSNMNFIQCKSMCH